MIEDKPTINNLVDFGLANIHFFNDFEIRYGGKLVENIRVDRAIYDPL